MLRWLIVGVVGAVLGALVRLAVQAVVDADRARQFRDRAYWN